MGLVHLSVKTVRGILQMKEKCDHPKKIRIINPDGTLTLICEDCRADLSDG